MDHFLEVHRNTLLRAVFVQLARLDVCKKSALTIALHNELDVERVFERYSTVVEGVIAAGSSLRVKKAQAAVAAPPAAPTPAARVPVPVAPPLPPPPAVAPIAQPLPAVWACRCGTPALANSRVGVHTPVLSSPVQSVHL